MWGSQKGSSSKKSLGNWSNIVVYGKCIILEFSWHEWRKSRKTTPNSVCLTGISNPLFGIEKIWANLHVHFVQPCFGCQQSQVCAVWVLDTPKLCLQHLLLIGTESHNTDIGVLWGQLGRHRLQHLRTNQKYCMSYVKLLTHNFRRIRKMAKTTISYVMSVRLSEWNNLGSHSTDVHVIWCVECFSKICPENSWFIKIGQERLVFYMKTKIHLNISRSVLLRMRSVSDKNCRENQKTFFMCSDFFFPKIMPIMGQCGNMF